MKDLTVFDHDWCPWRYPSNWIKNVRYFFRQFKWAYQRITKGFCDYDWWDMDTHLMKLIPAMLEEMIAHSISYPGNNEFPTPESWNNYLQKIVDLFHYSLSDNLPNRYEDAWLAIIEGKDILESLNGEKTPEEKEITKKFLNIEMTNNELRYEACQTALDMLKHVWGHLWD